jgi:hypothetical protein
VVYCAPQLRCSASAADGGDYFFDLDGSRPPLRLAPSAPVSAATRFFEVSEGRNTLQALYSVLGSSGVLPVGPNWGPAAEINVVVRVLRHLRAHWAKALPPRAAARQKSDEHLNSVQGFHNVLGLLAPQEAKGLSSISAKLSDAWIAEDMSPGGCGVIVPQGNGASLRVGMLVAMRTQSQTAWNIGIIRRVTESNYRQHHVGIQIVSRTARPVYLRTLAGARQGRTRECGILLSEQVVPGNPVQILMRRDLFGGREPVEAALGLEQTPVVALAAGGVVESGHDFDWLQYEFPAPVN